MHLEPGQIPPQPERYRVTHGHLKGCIVKLLDQQGFTEQNWYCWFEIVHLRPWPVLTYYRVGERTTFQKHEVEKISQ